MEIKHENTATRGRFFVETDGETLAEMTYSWAGSDKFIIDHTEVGEKLKGMGAGKKMVMAAVAYARTQSFYIIPICPFAKSVFDKDDSLSDVLFKQA